MAFVGDGNNVATSFVQAATMLGVTVHVATPDGFALPARVVADVERTAADGAELRQFTDPVAAVREADAVYTDVWTTERVDARVLYCNAPRKTPAVCASKQQRTTRRMDGCSASPAVTVRTAMRAARGTGKR